MQRKENRRRSVFTLPRQFRVTLEVIYYNVYQVSNPCFRHYILTSTCVEDSGSVTDFIRRRNCDL